MLYKYILYKFILYTCILHIFMLYKFMQYKPRNYTIHNCTVLYCTVLYWLNQLCPTGAVLFSIFCKKDRYFANIHHGQMDPYVCLSVVVITKHLCVRVENLCIIITRKMGRYASHFLAPAGGHSPYGLMTTCAHYLVFENTLSLLAIYGKFRPVQLATD